LCAELKTANQADEQVGLTVANQETEYDVRMATTTSSDGVMYRSAVTSSDETCQRVLGAPANLPLWIYCTRYTDRPPGDSIAAQRRVFVNAVRIILMIIIITSIEHQEKPLSNLTEYHARNELKLFNL